MKSHNGLKIANDASRNRSGGASAHLIGILSEFDPVKHDIQEIHVWTFRALLDQLPDYPWLIKHNPIALEQSLVKQLIWQAPELRKRLKKTHLSYFDHFFKDGPMEIVKRSYCDANFAFRVLNTLKIKRDTYMCQAFDSIVSALLQWNIRYHPTSAIQKIAPASVFYVVKKPGNRHISVKES